MQEIVWVQILELASSTEASSLKCPVNEQYCLRSGYNSCTRLRVK